MPIGIYGDADDCLRIGYRMRGGNILIEQYNYEQDIAVKQFIPAGNEPSGHSPGCPPLLRAAIPLVLACTFDYFFSGAAAGSARTICVPCGELSVTRTRSEEHTSELQSR